MEESLQIEPEKIAIGALLQAERGKQKLTRKQVAQELNLSEDMISALENDEEFNDISPTYVRGYQRAYVRLLGIVESEVLSDPAATSAIEKPHNDLHFFDKNLDLSKNNKSRSIITKIVTAAILCAIAVFSWPKISSFLSLNDEDQSMQTVSQSDTTVLQNSSVSQQEIVVISNSSSTETASNNIEEPELQKTTVNGITTQIINLANDLDQSDQLDKNTNKSGEDDSQSANKIESKITELLLPEENSLPENTNQADSDQQVTLASVNQQETKATITFVSNGESWLSIEDAESNNLYRNTLKLDRVTVAGMLPLYVSTGNVGVLRVLADQGEQQKVGIFGESKTVAKFFVDLDVDGQLQFTPR